MNNKMNLPSKLTIDIDGAVITVTNTTQSLVLTGTTPVPVARTEGDDVTYGAVIQKEQVDSVATPLIPVLASEKRPPRRYTTGRSVQVNIKATEATVARLHRLADASGVPLGEILDRALLKLEESLAQNIGAMSEQR